MNKIRVMLADDHQLFREGLHALLHYANDMDVVAVVKNGDELLETIEQIQPDVVLSDISMPGKTGIEACAVITNQFPEIKVIMLSMYNSEAYFINSIKSGAKGFLSKEISHNELLTAVRTVYAGGEYFDKEISNTILKEYAMHIGKPRTTSSRESILTHREKEIIKLVAESNSNTEIAEKLMISVRTVNAHKNNIMKKLHLKSNVDIVKYAIINKIIKL